jgi:hypothetical protein
MKYLSNWLRFSKHVHSRQGQISGLHDFVDLIDRVLDSNPRYELEWDDFISWSHTSPNIESIRERIAENEALFFSSDIRKRQQGIDLLLDERNRAAAIISVPVRPHLKVRRDDVSGKWHLAPE